MQTVLSLVKELCFFFFFFCHDHRLRLWLSAGCESSTHPHLCCFRNLELRSIHCAHGNIVRHLFHLWQGFVYLHRRMRAQTCILSGCALARSRQPRPRTKKFQRINSCARRRFKSHLSKIRFPPRYKFNHICFKSLKEKCRVIITSFLFYYKNIKKSD